MEPSHNFFFENLSVKLAVNGPKNIWSVKVGVHQIHMFIFINVCRLCL